MRTRAACSGANSDYYDTKTIKQYVAGNREQRQWIIQAARELRLMPTTEGSLDIEMNLTEAIDGYSGHEHTWPAFLLHSDVIRLFAESGIVYTPTILVAYGGPWAENYFFATENVVHDEKLARFTPYGELATKTRRRSAGWFHPGEHVVRLIGKTVADLSPAAAGPASAVTASCKASATIGSYGHAVRWVAGARRVARRDGIRRGSDRAWPGPRIAHGRQARRSRGARRQPAREHPQYEHRTLCHEERKVVRGPHARRNYPQQRPAPRFYWQKEQLVTTQENR